MATAIEFIKLFIELVKAIGPLAFPVVLLIIASSYKTELREALGRLRRAKLPGGEFELDAQVKQLEAATDNIKPPPPVPQLPPPAPKVHVLPVGVAEEVDTALALPVTKISGAGATTAAAQVTKGTGTVTSPRVVQISGTAAGRATVTGSLSARLSPNLSTVDLAEIAERAPHLVIVEISRRIERALADIIATAGLWSKVSHRSLVALTRVFKEIGGSESLVESLEKFYDVRNSVVHSRELPPPATMSIAVESGLRILDALQKFPIEWHVVKYAEVEIYSDEQCTVRRDGVFAVILDRPETPRGQTALPTTRRHFESGMRVSWEWNINASYGESWYVEPGTGAILYAWTDSAEFIGRPLDAL